MRLDVLGSSGTYPSKGGACAGYLLRHDGFSLWMDAGTGTLARLQQHLRPDQVDAIFLSHMHPDHMVDIYMMFFALSFGGDRRRGVPLLMPPGSTDFIGGLLSNEARDDFATVFDIRERAPGNDAELGPFRLRTFDSHHSAPNLMLRVEAGDRTFCYSGDTGPNPWLAQAARGADLFLCEATWQRRTVTDIPPIHLRAHEAGAAARDAGADRLVLTHLWPSLDAEVSRAEAAEAHDGDVNVAVAGEGFDV